MDKFLTTATAQYDDGLRIIFVTKDEEYKRISMLRDDALAFTSLIPMRMYWRFFFALLL